MGASEHRCFARSGYFWNVIWTQMCFSSTQRRRAFAGRHVFVLVSSSSLRGQKRTYLTILDSADHALFKMVRYVLLRPLRPELDAKTKTCLPARTRFCHLDEQAKKGQFEPAGVGKLFEKHFTISGNFQQWQHMAALYTYEPSRADKELKKCRHRQWQLDAIMADGHT
jgi:hypothetical protein